MAEQQNTANVIDDLKDINKIVNAVNASTNAISKILNSITKLSDQVDRIHRLNKSMKRVNKSIVHIQTITKSLIDALTTMTGVFGAGDIDKLNELLIDANEYALDENGKPLLQDGQKIIKTSRQTLPVIMCKISESIGKIIDAMGKLGNISINPISGLKAHIYMKHIGFYLSNLVDVMLNSFSGIDTPENKKIFDVLTTDPERTLTEIDNNKREFKPGENSGLQSEDKSKTTTQVIKGRMGVLDIITTILNIVEKLGTLKIPNSLYLKFIVNRYASIISSLIKDFTKEFSATKGIDITVLSKTADAANTVVESVLSISAMLGSPKQFITFYLASIAAQFAMKRFGKLLVRMIKMLNSHEFTQLTDDKYIESITTGFANIKDIVDSLISIMDKLVLLSVSSIVLAPLALAALLCLIPISLFLGGIKGIILLINFLFSNASVNALVESIDNIAKVALKLSASILLLATTIAIIALLGKFIEENWKTVIKTFLLIGLLLAIFALLGFAKEVTKEGAIAILIMSSAMILLSISMLLLYNATESMSWEQFGMIFAIIGGMIGIFALASFMSAAIFVGASAILFMSIPLLMISGALMVFMNVIEKAQKLGITEDTKEQIKLPIKVIESAVKAICDIGIKSILEASMKILPLLAITTGIGKIADVVQKLASLSIPTKFDSKGNPIEFIKMRPEDFQEATKNIGLLLTTILTSLGSDEMSSILDNLKGRSLENISKVLEASSGITNVIDAINNASKMDGSKIAKSIANIKESIVQYVGMVNDLFVRKGEFEMVSKTILGFNVPVPTYKETKAPEVDITHIQQAINGLRVVSDSTQKMNEIINTIAQVKAPNIGDVNAIKESILKFTSLLGTGDDSIKLNGNWKKKIDALEDLEDVIEDYADISSNSIEKTTTNFIKFVDKANKIDTSKIETITSMFKQMAEFSKSIKGDFDKLADVLSDKLVDILEKLHTTIEDMKAPISLPSQQITNNAQSTNITNKQESQVKQETQQKRTNAGIDTQSLENIESILTEMSMLVKEIKENTETTSF